MVTVGDSKTGKTSLLSVLKDGKVPEDTVPAIFDTFVHSMKVDGQKVELGLWDTACGEEYEALRRLSYPQCDVFVVCYSINSRKSFENVKTKWLPEVRKHRPLTPLVIVGTKKELRPRNSLRRNSDTDGSVITKPTPKERFVKYDEGLGLANDAGAFTFLECSAFGNSGVIEVFEHATRAVLKNAEEEKAKARSGRRGSGLLGMLKK